ncbi:hypothetical protein P2318_09750 [Myxococcaceae bacterium GXIMD 01537]
MRQTPAVEFLRDIFDGLRHHGRKGGVVALVVGVLLLGAALSLADEPPRRRRAFPLQVLVVAVALGIAGVGTGGWLLLTGGSSRKPRTGADADELREALASLPLPYALCVPCQRVVKSQAVHDCPRCGGELLDIQTEDDVAWAQETLAPRQTNE